jgi:hypothetical protein
VRILIVTWAWPPIGRIGSMRPLGMAREWTAAGHEIHVLTGPGDRGGEYAPDLEPEAASSGAVVHRAEAPGIPRPRALRAPYELHPDELAAPRRVSRLRQILAQWRRFPDDQRSWVAPALELALERQAATPFDLVWTTSPPESAHYVGRALARRGLLWVADFRDPWSDYVFARWDPLSRALIDRIARRLLAPARALTANAEGIADSLARATRRRVICFRNGFTPPPPPEGPLRPRTLGYFGRVDPLVQHPERLWAPLRLMKQRGTPWTLAFHLSPGGGGGARIRSPADLAGQVEIASALPHAQALARMQAMAALLVLAFEARGGERVVQHKLYEYVGSGRPLLVVAPPGFEARRLAEATGTGIGACREAELIAALERLPSFVVDAAGRRQLERRVAAQGLLELFESCRTDHS